LAELRVTVLLAILQAQVTQTQDTKTALDRLLVSPAAPQRIAAALLLLITLVLLVGFVRTVHKDPPRIVSHWGGFGGGLGGWHISVSLAFLLGTIAFGAMFTVVVRQLASHEAGKPMAADGKKADVPMAEGSKVDSKKAEPPTANGRKVGEEKADGATVPSSIPAPKR
jgi:hypothetical protein